MCFDISAEDDELTFSQGDVIALLELIGQEWGRGQIHGRIGIFPLSFTEVVEPPPPQEEGTTKSTSAEKTGEQTPEQKESGVERLSEPGLDSVEESHGFRDAVEGQNTCAVIQVHSYSGGFRARDRS
uniref:SH3 domain-containing protein n=1 Tax=Labrus bergylta TaxID=56723 RepID=A0A3Q3NJD9_9LABR